MFSTIIIWCPHNLGGGGHLPYKCIAYLTEIQKYRVVFADQDNMFKYVWKGYKIHPKTNIRVCFSKPHIEKEYFVKLAKYSISTSNVLPKNNSNISSPITQTAINI